MILRGLALAWFVLVVIYALDVRDGSPGLRETWEMLRDTERQVLAALCDEEHTPET